MLIAHFKKKSEPLGLEFALASRFFCAPGSIAGYEAQANRP